MPDRLGIVVDIQALQMPFSRGRGIGRYVANHVDSMLRLYPDHLHSLLASERHGVVDEVAGLLGRVPISSNRRTPRVDAGAGYPRVFYQTSPVDLGAPIDSLWPRWTRQTGVVTAATVYDMIPAIYEDEYLAHAPTRSFYWARLEMLRTVDLLLCISEATRQDLVRLLDIRPDRTVVIGAGAPLGFHPADSREKSLESAMRTLPQLRADYLMYTGGVDFRKNTTRLLQAYAALDRDLRHAHQLVIVCQIDREERQKLEAETRHLGIVDDVLFTGFVPDSLLVTLYQAARLFVFPSLYEGFGLPLIESIACGTPVIASRSSSLVEVVTDPDLCFDPLDPGDITAHMASVIERDDLANVVAEQQRHIEQEFSWDRVAERTISGITRVVETRRATNHVRRSRDLAILTPVPPQRSGVADYSWRLAHALAADGVGVELVVGSTRESRQAPSSHGVPVIALNEYSRLDAASRYTESIFVMGNSDNHAFVFDALSERPGYVMAHDARYTGFFAWYAQDRGLSSEWFEDLLNHEYAGLAPGRGRSGWLDFRDADRDGLYLIGPIIDRSTRLLTTSEYSASIARIHRPAREDDIVSIGFGHLPPAPRGRPIADEVTVIGSVGIQDPIKGTEVLVEAFSLLPAALPERQLMLLGGIDAQFERRIRSMSADLGLDHRVTITGWVDEDTYERTLATLDIAVQLRRASNGEVSAAVSDCLRHGIPTVVSDVGTSRDLSDGVVAKARRDITPSELASTLLSLVADRSRRIELSERAQQHVAEHSFSWAAQRLLDVL